MILNKDEEFSDDQAITVTAASTVELDLLVDEDFGKGLPVPIYIKTTEAFAAAGAATLTVTMETDNDVAFGSPTVIATTVAIPVATLVQGYRIPLSYLPQENERYLRLKYTVATGPFTAGKVDAFIGSPDHTNGANV